MLDFGLNQVTMSKAPLGRFLDTAAGLGCVGVELRNDLGRPVFDGISARQAEAMARDAGLRLLGLSQVYPFNCWSTARAEEVRQLVGWAQEAGAETISLIPRNDPQDGPVPDQIETVLEQILPILEGSGVIVVVEPLGFPAASLRLKSDVVQAVSALGGQAQIKLVHDTFHHALADEGSIFADETQIVHLSGVVRDDVSLLEMLDADRVLVDAADVLGNINQIRDLLNAGYTGAFSFECFAPSVRNMEAPEGAIRQSMDFISSQLQRRAA